MKATRILITAVMTIAISLAFTPKLRTEQTARAQDPSLKRLYVPYWTVADGYQSIVQLHNNLINDAILVRPVILTADGRQINLSDVRLGALENASINIGQALENGVMRESSLEAPFFNTKETSVER